MSRCVRLVEAPLPPLDGMRLSDLRGWHLFTYTQLYPAVLGSMLYDVLHIGPRWGCLQAIELSIAVFFAVDSLHLMRDLGSAEFSQADWIDTAADALVALVMGIAYWQVSDRRVTTGMWLVAASVCVFWAYHLRARRRHPIVIRWYSSVAALAVGVGTFATLFPTVTAPLAIAAWLPTVCYGWYVFRRAPAVAPTRQTDA